MQEYSTTDLANICSDVTKQRSLFLCIFSSCQSRHYGPSLASAILSCSGRGANISPLLPVEIQSEKLSGRQLSQDTSLNSDNIHDSVIANKLTLALDCNAGPDGVVTVSLSSPPTFATHIPQAAGFPDVQLSLPASGNSGTSAGPTVTQLQGRPPLPGAEGGQLTLSGSDQLGQAGQAVSATAKGTESDYETTSVPSAAESTSPSSARCGCSEETQSPSPQSPSAYEATVQQVSTHTTATSTSTHSTAASSCDGSSETAVSVATSTSSTSTSSSSTSSTSSTSTLLSASTTSSASEDSSCETSEPTTKHTSKVSTSSTPCSGDASYGRDMQFPKLPAQKTFSNATTTESSTSTLSTASTTNTGSSSSCDTSSTSSTIKSSATSSASSITYSDTSSMTFSASSAVSSAVTSSASSSSSKTTGSSLEADSVCSTSSSSKSTKTSSSPTTRSPVSKTHAVSQSAAPPAYTEDNLPQAYDTPTSMALPSYADAAPPEYSVGASVQAASATSQPSSTSSVTSTSSVSTSTSTSLSSSSAPSTMETIPSYGYNFQAASETATPASVASTSKAKSSQTASDEEHPSGAASFLSSEPGHEVENTASSESKSQIPGIETVPAPSKSSATATRQPPATTQVLPIGGGPPVLFVTIIEPDPDGNLETSVLTVLERSPWQTSPPKAEDVSDNTLRARVDGYRMGMASGILTQDSNSPMTTMSPVNTRNRTSTLADATSDATEISAGVLETISPLSLPIVSSASLVSCVGNLAFSIIGCIIGRQVLG